MNKLFTKIAALALGAAMAFGVGVAVSSKAKDVKPAEAADAKHGNWTLMTGSAIAAGDIILIATNDGTAYMNGGVSSGHFSTTTFNSTTPASNGTGSILVETITGKSTFKLKMTKSGNQYVSETKGGSGGATFVSNDTTGWAFVWDSTNKGYDLKYNNESKYVRSYNNATFRTYTSKNGNVPMIYKWVASGLAVTFNSNGGSLSPDSMSVTSGNTFIFPSPGTKAGYKFDGWSSNGGTTKYATGATSPAVTAAIEYTAYWSSDPVTSVTLALGTFTKSYYTTGSWDWEHLSVTYGTQSGASGTATGLTQSNFTFTPAAPNSTSITSVSVTVTYSGVTSSALNITGITVEDQPLEDTLTATIIGQTSYGDWSGKAGTNSDAVYAGNSTKSGNGAIQLRTTNSNSGIVTTASGGTIKKVSVTWNTTDGASTARNLDVYAKKTAYSAATDLYDSSKQGTKVGSIAYTNTTTYQTELEISGSYTYVGVRSASGALYINNIVFEWSASAEPEGPIVEITTAPAYLIDGGASGSLVGTITNDNSYTITWSASPSTGVTFSSNTSVSEGSVTVSFDGTTTGTTPIVITATLSDEDETMSEPINVYSLEHAGTSADPFSATDADVFCNTSYAAQSGGDWYVQGYVVGEIANNKGYYIDEDPTATSSPYKFEVYNNSGVTNETGKTITVGTSYIVAHGSMSYYGTASQSEITGSVVTSVDNGEVPTIGIDGGDRIVDIGDSVTLTVTKEHDGGAAVTWGSSDQTVATVSGGVLTLLKAGTTTITASMTVDAVVYSSSITLTVVKQAFDIGDEVYFYAEYNANTYYMCAVGGTDSSTTTEANKIVFSVVEGSVSGSVAFKHGDDYLKCTSSTPYSGSSTTLDADTSWTAIDEGTNIVITTCGSQTGRKLAWNYNNGSPRFGCYGTPSTTILLVSAGVAVNPTSVTLTQHAVTLENGSSTTLTYTSDNPGTFTWTTTSESIATVSSNGEVECLASSGTATIRIFYDTNHNGLYDAGEPTDTCVITAIPAQIHFGDANYGGIASLISADSTGTSLDGKKIIFGCASETVISGALNGQIISYHDTDETEFDVSYDSTNHKFTVGDGLEDTGVTVYTLHSISSNHYSISTVVDGVTKYLSETAVKKLAYSNDAYDWTITISSGNASIQSTNGYLKYNSGSPRFTTYASGQTDIEIYEYKSYYDEATEYAEYFLYDGTCQDTMDNWTSLSEMFADLTQGAQNIYKIATHEDPSTYDDEVTVEHAAARYDDAVTKHVELRSNEFMHRFGNNSVNGPFADQVVLNSISDSVNSTAIIVVTSMIGLSAVGGYFFLRKRKENI